MNNKIMLLLKVMLSLFVVVFIGFWFKFAWDATGIPEPGIDDNIVVQQYSTLAQEESNVVSSTENSTKTCTRSNIVDATAYQIDFMINKRSWILENPYYKLGFFGLVSWNNTPFLDNFASYQRGSLDALARTTIILSDKLARARGTSAKDVDLEDAQGLIKFTPNLWYVNISDNNPWLSPTKSSDFYNRAIDSLYKYNKRLQDCEAVIDLREDNFAYYLDFIAQDLGNISAKLTSASLRSNAGPFDMTADNEYWEAWGYLESLSVIMAGAKIDFADQIEANNMKKLWDTMEHHLTEALKIQPFIVSNAEESSLFAQHLNVIGFYTLRVRANLTEMSQILQRKG